MTTAGSDSGEDRLIERIRRRVPSRGDRSLRLGIGDDSAVLRPAPGREWVLSCDQFIEGAHFLAEVHPPEVVGYKALARATSDLAAMGAQPRFFMLSLMLPASRAGHWLDGMLIGMARGARRFGMTLIGGDTAQTPSQAGLRGSGAIVLNLTVVGEVESGRALQRDKARPGDTIFVTGKLGAAQLGLELVLRGMHRQRRWRGLLAAHNRPKPAIEIGRWLLSRRMASAMMDLSDGLSIDLARLCRASGVGAHIEERRLPIVSVPEALRAKGVETRSLALHGGEDYGLLFTVPKRLAARVPNAMYRTRVTRIGEIVAGRGMFLIAVDGSAKPLLPQGWDHFARAGR